METKTLDHLYGLRNKFIIIGLTGRLGSGCTTVADLLTNENFEDCNFPLPLNRDFKTNEDRKYRIVYNYLKENWKQYTLIRASDVITALLLMGELADIKSFLQKEYSNETQTIENIIEAINSDFETLKLKVEQSITKNGTQTQYKFELNDAADELFISNSEVSAFSKKLKEEFKKLKITNGSSPFQHFGNNIRMTGNPIDSKRENFDPSNSYIIAELIHQLIKIKRDKNGKEVRIVIDSIRNSMEARYFKERFSAFYLFGISTEDEYRTKRLSGEFTGQELEALDIEYKNLDTQQTFYVQDIKTCIQVADIYLHNPDDEQSGGDTLKTLKAQLVRYLALILQPGIITPTPEERCMQIAYTAKYNSGCISRQVGAVVTDDTFSVKSIGWNSTAEGQTPCLLRSVDDLIDNSDSEAFSDYEKNGKIRELLAKTYPKTQDRTSLKGRNISFCFKDGQNCLESQKNQVHTRSLHAEENAMLQISKYGGEGLKHGFLFTTASPCELCSKKAYQLGIKIVFYIDPYPGISQNQILRSGVIKHQPQLKLFVGAIGRAYHQLFEPFTAYKDELQILLQYDYEKVRKEINRDEHIKNLKKQREEIDKELAELGIKSTL